MSRDERVLRFVLLAVALLGLLAVAAVLEAVAALPRWTVSLWLLSLGVLWALIRINASVRLTRLASRNPRDARSRLHIVRRAATAPRRSLPDARRDTYAFRQLPCPLVRRKVLGAATRTDHLRLSFQRGRPVVCGQEHSDGHQQLVRPHSARSRLPRQRQRYSLGQLQAMAPDPRPRTHRCRGSNSDPRVAWRNALAA
jgi:hypothetical protein